MKQFLVLLGCLAAVAVAQDLELDSSGLNNLEEAYTNEQATLERQSRFYCLGYSPPDENVTYGEVRAIPDDYDEFWTLWVQFPVISYLDAARKTTLVAIIIDMMNEANGNLLNGGPILLEDVCIAFYDAINVAEYSEGVLIQFYFNGDYDSQQIQDAFLQGIGTARRDNSQRVIRFRGRNSIFLLGELQFNSALKTPFQEFPPASNSAFRQDNRDDPTFNAIIIFSGAGRRYERDISSRSDFASNPDPINYGLEAGDIVFAVFGSIFLAILSAMILLGFFIHPVFLA